MESYRTVDIHTCIHRTSSVLLVIWLSPPTVIWWNLYVCYLSELSAVWNTYSNLYNVLTGRFELNVYNNKKRLSFCSRLIIKPANKFAYLKLLLVLADYIVQVRGQDCVCVCVCLGMCTYVCVWVCMWAFCVCSLRGGGRMSELMALKRALGFMLGSSSEFRGIPLFVQYNGGGRGKWREHMHVCFCWHILYSYLPWLICT